MTDRRLTPANGRVAALRLKGQVQADRFTEGVPRRVCVPVSDLRASPGGPRDRQLLYGEAVTVYEEGGGFALVEAARDGYVGYVDAAHLSDPVEATHLVAVPATHLYPAPDIKRTEVMGLSFGSRLRIVSASNNLFETAEGHFVPKPHVRPANKPFTDPATVAQLFFGTPYLWGGNSVWGIDCSGLVQAAHLACAIPCPGDSDLQAAGLGHPLPEEGATLRRGDLVFWKGHVAIMVDEATILHANGHTMSVAYEPLVDTIARIADQGGGPVTALRRPG